MVVARIVCALGLLVVVTAFGLGTEKQWSASAAGEVVDCGPAIPASWLMEGTAVPPLDPGAAATAEERQAAAGCGPVVTRARVVVLSAVGAGGLLALLGGGALRVRQDQRAQQVPALQA